ncbi:MAG: hypothetical protein ACOYOF_09750 [Verrucomicrobiaceae bacterium]|jgi:hypothetical protein
MDFACSKHLLLGVGLYALTVVAGVWEYRTSEISVLFSSPRFLRGLALYSLLCSVGAIGLSLFVKHGHVLAGRSILFALGGLISLVAIFFGLIGVLAVEISWLDKVR